VGLPIKRGTSVVVVQRWWAESRPSKAMSNALSACFQGWVHLDPALAGWVERHDGEVDALERGLLVGEVATGLVRLADSMELVLHTIRRISRSNCRNGTNAARLFDHRQPHDPRVLLPHSS
jgi:hypothetical protein